jgi:hypothetical protein
VARTRKLPAAGSAQLASSSSASRAVMISGSALQPISSAAAYRQEQEARFTLRVKGDARRPRRPRRQLPIFSRMRPAKQSGCAARRALAPEARAVARLARHFASL